ncbi:PREDICTED: uncharacterized protein LOC103328346 [Prunus mume]|uniref:Uncharacterized protein LOC103328346 n=1 Tax=Prunus mume TaxID=102107 RepID=A0ABM0NS17_PRUMU|nr:PREDICTED: uncharacterized protein LOC103328346 [Prunus mume]
MAGSRTEVILNQQEPSGDGRSFPGRGRTLVEQEPPRESAQVNRQDQEGGGGIRIRDNNIVADQNAQNVGASNFGNVQVEGEGQDGGLDIRGNTITARGRASNVGFHNFGNTTPGWKCWIL